MHRDVLVQIVRAEEHQQMGYEASACTVKA